MPTTPHSLNNLLGFLLRHATFLLDGLDEYVIDFASHVRSVATDVEVGFLEEKFVDHFAIGGKIVLDVVFLIRVLAREGVEDGELVAEGRSEGLKKEKLVN